MAEEKQGLNEGSMKICVLKMLSKVPQMPHNLFGPICSNCQKTIEMLEKVLTKQLKAGFSYLVTKATFDFEETKLSECSVY